MREARDHFEKAASALLGINSEKVAEISDIILKARRDYKSIYVMGNGGSGSTASHFAADISGLRRGLRIHCLNDSMPAITALSNDLSFDEALASRVRTYVNEGDVVIVFSCSGRSHNIIRAATTVESFGATLIAFIGSNESLLVSLADVSLAVSSEDTEVIEDVHLSVCHAIKLCLIDRFQEIDGVLALVAP